MKMHLKYLWYVLRHKWFVFVECCRLGIPWRGLTHDLSKFRPREWFPYARWFYGTWPPRSRSLLHAQLGMTTVRYREDVKCAFDMAWLHHQKRNDHHWQYWLLSPDIPVEEWTLTSMDGGLTEIRLTYRPTKVDVFISDSARGEPAAPLQYEVARKLNSFPEPLAMPDRCRREMLADWRGAGRALGKPDTQAWYLKNKECIQLHPETRAWIEAQLQ